MSGAAGMSERCVVIFTLASVQEFIAAARRTQMGVIAREPAGEVLVKKTVIPRECVAREVIRLECRTI